MKEFEFKSICILGRQPALGLAELESVYGPEHVQPIVAAALLDIEPGEINFKQLGGTIKVGRILSDLPYTSWPKIRDYLLDTVPNHLKQAAPGKFRLGLSMYGLDVSVNDINRTALSIKKASERSMRIIPNKTASLSSAQVLHNKLTTKGAWELLLIKNGPRTLLAQTFFVQDIEAYSARDQTRPKRDSKVGMLPPKLAQIIVNLAMRAPEQKNKELRISRYNVLDPFCGTGVILQEALLMGYSASGSDIDRRMVDYTQQNLKWLYEKHPDVIGTTNAEIGDATDHSWPIFSAVATETYLGRPLAKLPATQEFEKIVRDVNTITSKFLRNLSGQMRPKTRACLALPAWQISPGKFKTLPLLDKLTDMGYNYLDFKHVRREDLIYYREGQIVGRQLIVLEKR